MTIAGTVTTFEDLKSEDELEALTLASIAEAGTEGVGLDVTVVGATPDDSGPFKLLPIA